MKKNISILPFLIVFIITCVRDNTINTLNFPKGSILLGQNLPCGYRFSDSTQFSWDNLENAKETADIWISDSIVYDTSYDYSNNKLLYQNYYTSYCRYLKGFLIRSFDYIIDLENDIFFIDSIDMDGFGIVPVGHPVPCFLFKTREGNKYGSFDIGYFSTQRIYSKDTIPGIGNDTIRLFYKVIIDSINISYRFDP